LSIFGGECVRPLGSGEQHAELLAQDRIGASVRNQHLGQYISTDGSKGFPGEGLSAAMNLSARSEGPWRR